ncbi:MAG: Gfo/Idh/MocA family oxidoreductase [Chloroflexota bacterium]|nr:Gfo/Idh/MocA family oxidoreductase [Chloroflexota bacterium]
MTVRRVRIGVIGTGIGAAHIKALQQAPGAVVMAICSAQRERAEQIARQFDIPRATDNYRDLLGADVDAVVITTPPTLHHPMALDAIAAGKHIFCEKPLAATLAEAVEMRDAAEAAGIVHMINHQTRFGATYAETRRLIDAGYLGTPTLADARINMNPADYLRGPMWSTSKVGWFVDGGQGGGILAGSGGPHLFDLLRWYWGEVEAVTCMAAVTVPTITLADGSEISGITAPDGFIALLRFVNGAMATVRGVPIPYHRGGFSFEFNGTAGALFVTHTDLRGATAADPAPQELLTPDAPEDRVGIALRFVRAIQEGEPAPAPNFHDGVAVQAILDALNEAIATREWVTVIKV